MTAALTWARLSFRQQRWELILVALGVAGAAIGMLWFAGQIAAMRAASPDCLGANLDQGFTDEGASAACQAILTSYYAVSGFADTLLGLSFGAPFGMGVLLGAPIVAREIDGGTAQLAWSLGRSRATWLLRRIAFITLFVAVALGALAVTSEILAAALLPDRTLAEDFVWFGRRGWLVVARGIGALMVGMLVGAVIGRVLPAILAAGLAVALTFTGVALAMNQWNQAEAVAQRFDPSQVSSFDMGALGINGGIEMLDGEIVTYSQLSERGIDIGWGDELGRAYTSEADFRAGRYIGYEVQMVIPGRRYPELVAREGAVTGGLGLVALGLATLVVRRRRPA